MAADRTDDPETINHMYKKISGGYDIVCPTRYGSGGTVKGPLTVKSLLSRMAGLSTPFVLGIPTTDLTYTFKMFRKNIMNTIHIESEGGFEFSEEMVIKAFAAGYSVAEIPTRWVDRAFGKSKFQLTTWLPGYVYWYIWGIGARVKHILLQHRKEATRVAYLRSSLLRRFTLHRNHDESQKTSGRT